MSGGDRIFTETQWASLDARLGLPLRQRQVIRHLFEGRSDKQIANELGIALPTVRSHLQRIYSKYDVQDRTELVLYIVSEFIRMDSIDRNGMLNDDS